MSEVLSYGIYLLIFKFDVTDVSWYDYSIILKSLFRFMVHLSEAFSISEIEHVGRKIPWVV
jgi:hypothetical protein